MSQLRKWVEIMVSTKTGGPPVALMHIKWNRIDKNTFIAMMPRDQISELSLCTDIETWERIQGNLTIIK